MQPLRGIHCKRGVLKGVKNERKSNFELLRILCCLFVISYHMIAQSNALASENGDNFLFSVIFHSCGRIAIAVFIMISSHFLVDTPFKIKRVLRVYLKTLLVCLFVTLAVWVLPLDKTGLHFDKACLVQLLPVVGVPYSFILGYMFLLLVSPILNLFLHDARYDTYRKRLIILFAILIGICSFPPFGKQAIFRSDELIFCFIYLLIGELKLKSKTLFKSNNMNLCIALLCLFGAICSVLVFDKIKEVWPYAWEIRFFYISVYQSILPFGCALFLFEYFRRLEVGQIQAINWFGKRTFGVFLIHQVPILYQNGWLRNRVFHLSEYFGTSEFIPYCYFVLFCVFFCCVGIDVLFDAMLRRIMDAKWFTSIASRVSRRSHC